MRTRRLRLFDDDGRLLVVRSDNHAADRVRLVFDFAIRGRFSRCACARRRWSASVSAMPVARVSLRSWALSLSVRAIPWAMSGSSSLVAEAVRKLALPDARDIAVACVRLRSCSRPWG